ncbi:MAG: hypothetical protein WDO24_23775 [Pseudomonadota bacterium]
MAPARDQVVVPLQQARDPINQGAPRLGGARLTRIEPSHSAPAASVVTQITDYRPVRRSAALAGASAPSPRSRAGVGNFPTAGGGASRAMSTRWTGSSASISRLIST